jgi:ABC-type transport system substrate-binding protein/ABC-type dipeptide/oligopeptide/nickel transport system permease subunit
LSEPAARPSAVGSIGRALLRSPRARPGVILFGALTLFSLVGPWLLPPPDRSHFALDRAADGGPAGPSFAHPLGVDSLLRDELARLAHGGRTSLAIAVVGALAASMIGAFIGVVAASTARGRYRFVDVAIVRLIDVVLALPFLLVVTAIGAALGRSDVTTLFTVLAAVGWAGSARVIRAEALVVLELPFVSSARALGAGTWRIAHAHVLPNVAGLWVVMATGAVGSMILAEAVLGYLGVGLAPPDATWGRMLHEAETLLAVRPLLTVAPAACIVFAVLAANRVGEGLRDAIATSRSHAPRHRAAAWDLAIACCVLVATAAWPPAVPDPPRAAAAAQAGETPRPGGELRVATYIAVRTLDPALAYDEPSGAIGRLVWERLLEIDDDGRLVPRIATSFAWTEEGRALELTLRETARFSDGTPLAAADVKRSIERALHPKTPCPGATYYEALVGFEPFRKGAADHVSGIEVVDPHRIRFRTSERSPSLVSLLSLGFAAPVCPSATAPADPNADIPPCGAGPFTIGELHSEEGVRLVRNERYDVPGVPLLDAIDWRFNVRSQVQRFKIEAGELDITRDLTPSDALLFRASPAWRGLGVDVPTRTLSAVFMNVEMPPFDRVEVRRAVSYALDPSVLPRVRPDIVPLDTVVPSSVPGHAGGGPPRVHDLGRALAHMARAGLPYDPATGEGGWPDPVDYVTVSDSFEQATAEIWQQQLAAIGIRVRLRTWPFATYLAEVKSRRRAAMGWVGWGADYPDPLNFFEPTLTSRAIGDPSQNYAFFADEELDDVVARAMRELDPARRKDLVARAESIVRDRAPWVPTHTPQTYAVRLPRVRGWKPTAGAPQDFSTVWLADAPPPPLAARSP